MKKKSKTINTDSIVVFFVEGETDELFYKRLIEELRHESCKKGEKFKQDIKIIVKNLSGIGQYKTKAARIIRNKIKRNNRHCRCCVILCYDTDVFEFQSKPPFQWNEVAKELKKNGVDEVKFVKASHSIEDWFLIDTDGVLSFLGLPASKNKVNYASTGLVEIERLFKKANRMYIKGRKCEGFIESLNMKKILSFIFDDIKAIYEELIEQK